MMEDELYRFADWVASEVCQEDFETSAGVFAELACRKLYFIGLIRKDGDKWTYKKAKEKE